jgi:small subunit ribosomal protein S8
MSGIVEPDGYAVQERGEIGQMSDPIADVLTRIRNASKAQRRFVDVRLSKLKRNLMKILEEQGFVEKVLVKEEGPQSMMRIFLKYSEGRESVIHGLKRVSKPSLRRYVGWKEIPLILGGMGISILSTPQGVMVGQEAHKRKLGGEVLCYIW